MEGIADDIEPGGTLALAQLGERGERLGYLGLKLLDGGVHDSETIFIVAAEFVCGRLGFLCDLGEFKAANGLMPILRDGSAGDFFIHWTD